MPAVGANITIRLSPSRRTMAKSCARLLEMITRSDSILYTRGKGFLPIFPEDDPDLAAAVTLIRDRCLLVINPQPVA